jgi:hypothetical protein
MKLGQWVVSGYISNHSFIGAGCILASVNFSMLHPKGLQSTLREENRSKARRYIQTKCWGNYCLLMRYKPEAMKTTCCAVLYKFGYYVIGLATTCLREWNHRISETRQTLQSWWWCLYVLPLTPLPAQYSRTQQIVICSTLNGKTNTFMLQISIKYRHTRSHDHTNKGEVLSVCIKETICWKYAKIK